MSHASSMHLPEARLRDIEHFFRSYNQAQGREFKIDGRGGVRQARQVFRDAVRRFKKARSG